MVAHLPSKQMVAGSSPVSRSTHHHQGRNHGFLPFFGVFFPTHLRTSTTTQPLPGMVQSASQLTIFPSGLLTPFCVVSKATSFIRTNQYAGGQCSDAHQEVRYGV